MRTLKTWSVMMVVVLALAACARDEGTSPDDEAQVVRIYEVPAAQLQPVQRALREVLALNNVGSVSSSDGHLMVLAPAGTQSSIAQAIEELSTQPAAGGSASNAPIRLRFWLLEGRASPASPDPRLEALKPALEEASKGLGVQGYTLIGFADLLATPGKNFESQANNFGIDGHASRSAAGVSFSAIIDMVQPAEPGHTWTGRIRTDVLLEPEQFLVLGTSAAADGSMRLLVVQAQLPAGED